MSKFSEGGRFYTHKKCEDGHIAKVRECDWTEQDVCPKCDGLYDLYDHKRKMTATEDRTVDAAIGR